MSTGMPAGIWLHKFGVIVRDYFGHVPYHVGSSLKSKDWRDVDVRLILPDAEFAALFGDVKNAEVNPKLAAITLAFAALGEEMTGLPIDFQIQPQSHANDRYGGEARSALIELHPDQHAEDLRDAVLEAEEHDDGDPFRRGYAVGLRVAAGIHGMPEGVDPETRRERGT